MVEVVKITSNRTAFTFLNAYLGASPFLNK